MANTQAAKAFAKRVAAQAEYVQRLTDNANYPNALIVREVHRLAEQVQILGVFVDD